MQDRLNKTLIEDLVQFRKTLHQRPELSEQEQFTPQLILDFLGHLPTAKIHSNVGGYGLAIIFEGKAEGPTTLFRCELDALPIQETNTFDHKSRKEGVSHKCGHDGHMAILAGLGKLLKEKKPERGKVVLLFQPAEETGTGAAAILHDPLFSTLKPDYCYALHNVPQLRQGTVYVKSGTFAAASRGMTIKLYGSTAHAAEPENGINPANAMAKIIQYFAEVPSIIHFQHLTLVTVVQASLGKIAFGISPGYAEVRATLRAYLEEDMEKLIEATEKNIYTIGQEEKLKVTIDYSEIFPETANNEEAVSIIKKSAKKATIPLVDLDNPFRWSEDFGHFLLKHKGAIFALGAGENVPKLHNHDYDFPDEIIPTGILMFLQLIYHHNG